MASASRQLLGTRLSLEDYEVLEAAAYVRELSLQTLVEPALHRFADDLRKEDSVQMAIAARVAARREESGDLPRRLRPAR